MKNNTASRCAKKLFAASVCILCALQAHSQMASALTKLPLAKWTGQWKASDLTYDEKLERLSYLPVGDSVQFELPDYDPDNEFNDPRYFPLDVEGLHYIDLDFDGDLDLLYSGASGWLTLMDTKVYLFENDTYQLLGILNGRILDIQKKGNSYEVYTLWVPCCDSYTARIETNMFTATEQTMMKESIAIIGLRHLDGMPDFGSLPAGHIRDADLYASQEDFMGTHPYFGDHTKAIREALRNGDVVSLIKLSGNTQVTILDQKSRNGEAWYLVLTDPVMAAPRSLYEWSDGAHRRFVGWVKQVTVD